MCSRLLKHGISCKTLKHLDLFGERVNFSFQQDKTYNTTLGGFISVMVLCVLISFVVMRTTKLISREDPFFSMTRQAQEDEIEPATCDARVNNRDHRYIGVSVNAVYLLTFRC